MNQATAFTLALWLCLSPPSLARTAPATGDSTNHNLATQPWERVAFFPGLWKATGREVFEEWAWNADSTTLVGRGYRIVDGNEVTTETLQITFQEDHWVYQATVPNQNEGATISFHETPQIGSSITFTNPTHDFPKSISYTLEGLDTLRVRVEGEPGQGFSLILHRVPQTH